MHCFGRSKTQKRIEGLPRNYGNCIILDHNLRPLCQRRVHTFITASPPPRTIIRVGPAVDDAAILREIERHLAEWFKTPGWAEENAGFRLVLKWIEELRDGTLSNLKE